MADEQHKPVRPAPAELDLEAIRREVQNQHDIRIGREDPIFATVLLNHQLLTRHAALLEQQIRNAVNTTLYNA